MISYQSCCCGKSCLHNLKYYVAVVISGEDREGLRPLHGAGTQ